MVMTKKEKKENCAHAHALLNSSLRTQIQSPQLRESDPTFWILNPVLGIGATPPTAISARSYQRLW
jgi:hypothetical protein